METNYYTMQVSNYLLGEVFGLEEVGEVGVVVAVGQFVQGQQRLQSKNVGLQQV